MQGYLDRCIAQLATHNIDQATYQQERIGVQLQSFYATEGTGSSGLYGRTGKFTRGK